MKYALCKRVSVKARKNLLKTYVRSDPLLGNESWTTGKDNTRIFFVSRLGVAE